MKCNIYTFPEYRRPDEQEATRANLYTMHGLKCLRHHNPRIVELILIAIDSSTITSFIGLI